MESWVVALIVGLLASPFAALVTWSLTRKRTEAETNNYVAEGAQTAVQALREVLEQVRLELRATQEELEKARAEIIGLRLEVEMLKDRLKVEMLPCPNCGYVRPDPSS